MDTTTAKASRIVLSFYSEPAFPALRIPTRPSLDSLVAADIGVVGPTFFVRTTRCALLTGIATMELSNLLANADVDADDLHISSYAYHAEDFSATLVISAYSGRASIELRAYHLPAPMHMSEAMAIERRRG